MDQLLFSSGKFVKKCNFKPFQFICVSTPLLLKNLKSNLIINLSDMRINTFKINLFLKWIIYFVKIC